MKIAVIGGTGLVGALTVQKLQSLGHETIAASPSTGVDTVTGTGLTEVMRGADAIIDVTNSPSIEDSVVLRFFETSTRNLLLAEAVANVRHHVVLSVIGADRLADSGYMRAKVVQENLVRTSTQPYTIVRATQFFEFLGTIASVSTRQNKVHLPAVYVQPVAAADVASALSEVALGIPANGTIDLAGPESYLLDKLIQKYLSAIQDPREVVTDPEARYFGALLGRRSLLPGDNPLVGRTHFEQWLKAIGKG